MTYRINDIYTTKPGWIQVVWDLMEKYFIQESRPKIRSWGLQCLLQIYKSNRQIHEEEIFRKLILPTFTNFDKESELVVRLEGIKVRKKTTRCPIFCTFEIFRNFSNIPIYFFYRL